MTLYHGSNVLVSKPQILVTNRMLDFGAGFYTTSSREQAVRWAKTQTIRRKNGSPIISIFDFDEGILQGISILKFDSANREWLRFVTDNRKGMYIGKKYDLVIGPVANDNTMPVINNYMSGMIDEETALILLKPQKLSDQYAFLTEKGISILKFDFLPRMEYTEPRKHLGGIAMLLQFSVTNHRSIKDTAIISLKASTDKSLSDCLISPDEKKQLVPVLALYGANAAGKSNVLHALLLMREMVCGRYAKLLKGESLPQEPFAFTDQPTQPTSFEAIYFYGGIKYAYGFSFDKSKVLTEYLYHWPNGREALVFSREGNGYQFRENVQEQLTLAGRTAENRLYLSSSNEWNCPQTEKAYLWFFEKLTGFMGTEMRLDATLSAIRQGGSEKSRILHEMLYADLGIKDIRITGSKEEPIISALHTLDAEDGTSKGFWLPLGQESVGTQRFFSHIGMWLAALESGSVLVVDEIESSMHPLLTRHLIEMVQDAAINTNHAQLIFTTHDTGLLDLTLLRRDQIWFAEKDEKTMQTDIYALTEFSPRKGENIAKGYLQGRYGAIPFIGGNAVWAE